MKTRLISALLAGAFLLITPITALAAEDIQGGFIHHVFFWLKEPANAEHRDLFLKEVKKLGGIPTVKQFAAGTPVGTPRDVVDNSWTFDLLVTFEDKAGWQVYNDHQIHLDFIKDAGHVWEKVLVYDSYPED